VQEAHHVHAMGDTPPYDEAARERHFRELSALLERTFQTQRRDARA
jgi:hypothetical protein